MSGILREIVVTYDDGLRGRQQPRNLVTQEQRRLVFDVGGVVEIKEERRAIFSEEGFTECREIRKSFLFTNDTVEASRDGHLDQAPRVTFRKPAQSACLFGVELRQIACVEQGMDFDGVASALERGHILPNAVAAAGALRRVSRQEQDAHSGIACAYLQPAGGSC